MVPNPQDAILYLVDNGLGWKGANIKTLWLHFSHFVCHRFSKDVNSFFQSMVLHWITLFVPIQRSRIATLYENLKKERNYENRQITIEIFVLNNWEYFSKQNLFVVPNFVHQTRYSFTKDLNHMTMICHILV